MLDKQAVHDKVFGLYQNELKIGHEWGSFYYIYVYIQHFCQESHAGYN